MTTITRNQSLASLFLYSGLDLLEVQRTEDGRLRFVYDDPEGTAKSIEQAYYEDGCAVTSARDLLNADRTVREAVRAFFKSEQKS